MKLINQFIQSIILVQFLTMIFGLGTQITQGYFFLIISISIVNWFIIKLNLLKTEKLPTNKIRK